MVYRHILLASGGAEHSRKAEAKAVALAKRLEVNLSLISVARHQATLMAVGGNLEYVGDHELYLQELAAQQEKQAQLLKEAEERCIAHGLRPSTYLRSGNAGKQIVETATELSCDLVVVGSRQLSILGTMTQGSVSDYVMRHAPCDVLIVHKV
ncbi:MAG: universal stress protein [Trueperaceae bacterium]|nr:universal stress protein [Trueperaceae bacterium]